MLKKIKFTFFFLLLVNTYAFGQFTTTGDAVAAGCNCFDLTADTPSENGAFYRNTAINLNAAFNFEFTVNFGCEDTGGEGLAFVMQNGPWTTGAGGYGMGYEGIGGNVLSIEFDTRDNESAGEIANFDIASDHISLQDNGDIDHAPANPNNLLGIPSGLNAGEVATPHAIKPGFPNLEDCEDHLVEISWIPGANQTLQVKVDGVTSFTYIGNMIAAQFGGNPNVIWGWTGSTSAVADNVQSVCLALEPSFTYSPTNCPGELVSFTDMSSAFYTIVDWSWDFDGLGTSALENPTFTFPSSGSYAITLSITDDSGCSTTETIEMPIGFDTETSADEPVVCIGESTVIHAEGIPFEASTCCFKLVLNDLWGDYWGSGIHNEIEIYVDGVFYDSYTPTSFDPGAGTTDTIDLCFDQGAELEFIIDGADSPVECSYYFLDEDLNEIIGVNGGAGEWIDGASETHTVDCGISPPVYTYLWDNAGLLSDATDSDPTATVIADTWFHVEITDPGTGCTILDSVLIAVHPEVIATISGFDQICAGDLGELTIDFIGDAPYDINITGPSGPLAPIVGILTSPYTLNVGEDGIYNITFVTGNGCEGTFSGTGEIEVITPFSVDIEASANYCDGDAIIDLSVILTGGGTVNWYDNPGLIPPAIGTGLTFTPGGGIGSTTYYAAETESILGCEGPADNVVITINPIPPAPTYTGETSFCEGDFGAELTGIPSLGGTITWYDAPPPMGGVLSTDLTFSPPLVAPGSTLYLTETADGCESSATLVEIEVNPTPPAPLVTGIIDYCEGDIPTNLTTAIGGGGTIEWRDASGVVLGSGTTFLPTLTIGTFDLYVYETLGVCESEPTIVTITVQAGPTVEVPEEAIICAGDSIRINALNNGYDINWSDGQIGETVWLGPEVTTTYIVTTTNPACGSNTDEITIIVIPIPAITTANDTTIGAGGEAYLWAISENEVSFSWSPSILSCLTENCSSVIAVPGMATAYVVSVIDENGCQNSDTIFVDIDGTMELFVPNIFSPNGDGFNDKLEVLGPRLFDFQLEIYDRWGKKVFTTNEQKDYWDGSFKGEILSPQTFVYILTGETINGQKIIKEGNVSIIR